MIPMKWQQDTNCITEWQIPSWPERLSFLGWGCEVGNGFGFFAHERLGGFGCQILGRELIPSNGNSLESNWQIKLPKAKLAIHLHDELISPTYLSRKISVTNNSRLFSWIGDAVLRLVIPWEEGLVAELGGQDIDHKNANTYHETEEPSVSLRWVDGKRLVVSWGNKKNLPPALTPYLYVRDQPFIPKYSDRLSYSRRVWVIHARLLVDYPAALVFRLWRNPFVMWDRGFFGRYLLSTHYARKYWRGGELRPGVKRLIFGLWPLLPSQSLNFDISVEAR
jgi:hypothetical protein